ncbi:TetR/AcrR family transcriptional regulator [Sphingomonas sp. TDK1]|uniref:TetR/AcrR family transcriptional regulator n=1 Tax=Sphingomonas sp. TDK1 TaxID=453247 RepID=UPI0007DA008D|nr:TetR/AcrR family transcriptional regulator [Sphingomonas sp. TDK1]OAN62338.1 TetR family transcriptional regulator [Sphingomonas sp. TDK1]
MSAEPAERRPYHREDLRRELLEAALAHVRDHGHHGLSVRTLAQAVGVSPGAPYHHFKDRRELLLAIALHGYEALGAAAAQATASASSARERLLALCISFVDFAQLNPRLLELMYESELTSPTPNPALLEHQHAGRAALQTQLESALPALSEEARTLRLLSLWSTVYGFASLRNKRLIDPFEPATSNPDAVARGTLSLAVDAALRQPPGAVAP